MKPLFIMRKFIPALLSLLILSLSADVIAQGRVERVNFEGGLRMQFEGADRRPNGGADSFRGEGNSRRNDNPTNPPTATPQRQQPTVDLNKVEEIMVTPTSRKALQNIRQKLYANTTIKYTLLGGFLLGFFTSNKWEQINNVIKFYGDNELEKITNVFSPLNNVTKRSIINEVESTMLDLDRERGELNAQGKNSFQVGQEYKFWGDLRKHLFKEISATISTTRASQKNRPNVAVPMYKLYEKQIYVDVTEEGINKKKSRFINRIVAPNSVLSKIDKVVYFYNDESFDYLESTSSASPDFMDDYIGWGCLTDMKATIYFKDGSYLAIFYDACDAIDN